MKKIFKDKKAITLIALVITIVVLVILASVTISLTLGNNGLFAKAKEARDKWQNAQNEEEMKIAKYSNEIDTWSRAGISNINYTTYEQDTGLKWIDGSAIYQKTYQLSSSIAISYTGTIVDSFISDITNSIKQFVYAQGYNTDDCSTDSLCIGNYNGHWYIWCAEDSSFNIITLQYTKK